MVGKLGKKYDKQFYQGLAEGSVRSAELILKRLYSVYKPDSVVDFGCGIGAWLSAAERLGSSVLKGYDGNWVDKNNLISKNIKFDPVSLEEDITLNRKYDLCVSVEVAEHLSPNRSIGFVKQLCAAADVVLFGAAVKGQGGTNHINEQWQSYWVNLFHSNGYQHYDIFRGALWNDERIEWWYRQNILLFVKREVGEAVINTKQLDELQVPIVDIVHPEHLNKVVTHPLIAFKRYIQSRINSR